MAVLYMSKLQCEQEDDWLYTLSDICWLAGSQTLDAELEYFIPYTVENKYNGRVRMGGVHLTELDPLAYLYRHTWNKGIYPREQVVEIETRLTQLLEKIESDSAVQRVLNAGTRRDLLYIWGVFRDARVAGEVVTVLEFEPPVVRPK